MARAVLFDLDGTLLDPNGSIRDALDHCLIRGGFEPTGDRILIGMPLRHILESYTQDEGEIEGMVEAFRRRYNDHSWQAVRFYPGVLDVLATCRSHGVATGIVTTKGEDEARRLLAQLGVADQFGVIIGDNDVRPVKPHPAPVLAGCDALGVRPHDACMVGDTRYDIEAGRAAGTATIGVTWGHGLDLGGADWTVADADELWTAIEAWA